MKRLLVALPFVVLTLFAAGGCGGDDDDGGGDGGDETLTLQAYFDEVDSLVDAYVADNDASFSVLNESDDLEELKRAFALLPEDLSDFLTALDALATPSEAEAAEADVQSAGEPFLAELEEVNEAAQATTSVDDFVQTASSTELQALSDAFNATCAPLQQVATDNGVEIELSCPQ